MENLKLFFYLNFFAVAIALCVALLSWQRRRITGGLTLFFLMLSAAHWGTGNALEIIAGSLPEKILWSQITYIGALAAPVLILIMALNYTGQTKWLHPRRAPFLFLVPLITLILAFTNEKHGLIWTSFTPSPANPAIIQYGHGIGAWVGTFGYSYLCLVVGTVLILRAAIRRTSTYRLQSISMLLAISIPWAANLIYVAGVTPFPGIDTTSIAFSLAGIVTAVAIFRFQLLDLTPIARHMLVENMPDGLIVLDDLNRVSDINPSARLLLNATYNDSIGKPAADLLGRPFDVIQELDPSASHEMHIEWGEPLNRHLDVNLIPISVNNRKVSGRLITIRDVTEQKRIEKELQQANETLRAQLDKINLLQDTLREQAFRDSLTGLYNRRFLNDVLVLELERAEREQIPISLVLLDLDFFKLFNDTNGHPAGDEMLRKLGEILRAKTRQGDFACRYGGEEFVIVMPGAPLAAALKRAEEWRCQYEASHVVYEGAELKSTFSAGVACFPSHATSMEGLINSADEALYEAKRTGRNRVRCPALPKLTEQNERLAA